MDCNHRDLSNGASFVGLPRAVRKLLRKTRAIAARIVINHLQAAITPDSRPAAQQTSHRCIGLTETFPTMPRLLPYYWSLRSCRENSEKSPSSSHNSRATASSSANAAPLDWTHRDLSNGASFVDMLRVVRKLLRKNRAIAARIAIIQPQAAITPDSRPAAQQTRHRRIGPAEAFPTVPRLPICYVRFE